MAFQKIKFLSLKPYLPALFLGFLWSIYPFATSKFIDTSDTLYYVDFYGTVGYRLPITALVRLFLTFGISPPITAFFLNFLSAIYLLFLLKKMGMENGWVILLSPLILLSKNNIFTDSYVGLLVTHALLLLEERCFQTDQESFLKQLTQSFFPGFLIVLAFNIKETAILLLFCYSIVSIFQKKGLILKNLNHFLALCLTLIIFWLFSRACFFFIYHNAFHDYTTILGKSKGGNVPSEIVGARLSVPVPLTLFHLYTQIRIVGRSGLSALIAIFAAFHFRKQTFALVYLLGLIVFTLLASKGYLVLERYWAIFLPIQIYLTEKQLNRMKESESQKKWVPILIRIGIFLSLTQYFSRYFLFV